MMLSEDILRPIFFLFLSFKLYRDSLVNENHFSFLKKHTRNLAVSSTAVYFDLLLQCVFNPFRSIYTCLNSMATYREHL